MAGVRVTGPYRHAVAVCAVLVLSALLAPLSGCARKAMVLPVMSEQCLRLGGDRQEVTVQVPARAAAGLLHVAIRERGISALARIDVPAGNGDSASPIDRLGTITLVSSIPSQRASTAHLVPVRISSIDSRDITGNVCISAATIIPATSELARAQTLIAEADRAVAQRAWQSALDDFLAAAHLFDAMAMPDRASDARYAIAELEYGYTRRQRDAMALATAVLLDGSRTSPEIRALRLMLAAKALLPQAYGDGSRAALIDELIGESARLFRLSDVGLREVPRLETLSGFLQYRRGHTRSAAALFNKAANECRALRDWECFGRAEQNLAALAEDEQNYPAALADYTAAFKTLDPSRFSMLSASISDNLGRLQGRVGLIHLSEQSERTAMRLYARIGDCDGARRAASTLGEMLVSIGSIGEATIYLDKAISLDCHSLFASLSDDPVQSSSSSSGAPPNLRLPTAWGTSDRSYLCSRQPSIRDLTPDGNVAMLHALLAAAEIAQISNRFADASRCLALARGFAAGDIRSQIRLANARGQLAALDGLPGAARSAFEEALQLTSSAGLSESSEYGGTALLGLGDVNLRTGEHSEARRDAVIALRLSCDRADISRVVAALRLIAAVDRQSGRSADAERLLRSSIRLLGQVPTGELDAETRATYLATQYAVYAELTDLLGRESARETSPSGASRWKAFEVADEGHARSLRYALDQSSLDAPARADSGAAQKYRELMGKIVHLASTKSRAQDDARLIADIQQLSLSEPTADALDSGDLAEKLAHLNATLVEYATGPSSMFAFIVEQGSIHVVDLGDLSSIERAASEFVAQLRSAEPDPDKIRAAAQAIAKRVVWPITPFIHQQRIFLVPAGALHTVPFAAVPWSSTQPSDLMVRHAEISILPSALFIDKRAAASWPARSARFVLIGDPVIRSNIWQRTCAGSARAIGGSSSPFAWTRYLPSLPGTRAEVLAVARLVRQSHSSASVESLLGCAATPAMLRAVAPEADLLHIATHGLVDVRRPRLSALVLTPDTDPVDDGAVQLLDILGMQLRARLVVLSACDTSSGRLLPGEGVLGLAQAFLQSGAETVVASLWRVEDQETARFMERFYYHLLIDRWPAASALRGAQLDLATANDYSWAAFALYGRPDAVL